MVDLTGWAWCALAGLPPLIIYLFTLAPTVYGLDSAELTTGAYALGIVHAPGSPLYLLIGHLFAQLPIGDVGYRLNLMSACAVAGALVLLFRLGSRLVPDRPLLMLGSVWSLGFTYYVWIAALAAELYAVQATFVAGLLLLAWLWREEGRPGLIYAWAFAYGLGLGVHLSLVLLAPGFLIILLAEPAARERLTPKTLLLTGLCGLAGAMIYLYLPIRYLSDTPLNYARQWGVDLTTVEGLLWMVSGRMFGASFFSVPLSEVPGEFAAYLHQLWSNFLGVGVILGLLGLFEGFRRRPGLHIGLLVMFGSHLTFYLTYNVGDKALMFVPTFLVWGIWLALGVAAGSRWLEEIGMRYAAHGIMLTLTAAILLINFSYADISSDRSARELGEAIFDTLAPHAVYIGSWKDVPILEYLQIVESRRSDVDLHNVFFVTPRERERLVEESLAAERPVYTFFRDLVEEEVFHYQLVSGCDCFRVTLSQ